VKIDLLNKVNASGEVVFHEASGLDTLAIAAVHQLPDKLTTVCHAWPSNWRQLRSLKFWPSTGAVMRRH